MINTLFLVFLALHIWAVIVVRTRDPISSKVSFHFSRSRRYFIKFVHESSRLFVYLFLDIFISIEDKSNKHTKEYSVTDTTKDRLYQNISESDYPNEILSISTKFKDL
tara:strand:- start:1300 stop:1623 length:324 start_codon:yes stop_codon:yes gene_type:complete